MATSPRTTITQQLRHSVLLRDGAGMTDGQLLTCFLEDREEAAFAALVQRHGPMVWGVCRRLLGKPYHAAEDAFQATFLVLVQKAASIAPREMVANWLYGVAHQTARKARALNARRRARERQMTEMPEPEAQPPDHDLWLDLQPLLDQELSRLPDRYRIPIVVCDLEGKSIKEATRQLGWPQGTVAGRLARARKLLAQRLARRGLVVSGGALGVVLAYQAASAGVPASAVSATIQAATLVAAGPVVASGAISADVAALTEGVLRAMFLSQLKTITAAGVVGLLVILAAGTGLIGHRLQAAPRTVGSPEPSAAAPRADPAENDKERLQGTWVLVSGTSDGKKLGEGWINNAMMVVKGEEFRIVFKDEKKIPPGESKESKARYTLDPTAKPKGIDIQAVKAPGGAGGAREPGIYSLEGDTLTLCVGKPEGERPVAFMAEAGSGRALLVFERDKGATARSVQEEIDLLLRKVEQTSDRKTALETLDRIDKRVRQTREKVQQRQD